MSQVVILDSETLKVIDWYFSDSPVIPVTPGITLPVPAGLTWDIVKGVSAEDGTVTISEDPSKVQAKIVQVWYQLRAERNARLAASDWTQLQDSHISQDRKDAWAEYRQELRDLPDLIEDPAQVTWPLKPGEIPPTPVTGSRFENILVSV